MTEAKQKDQNSKLETDRKIVGLTIKVTVDLQGPNFAKINFFAYSMAEKGIYDLVEKLI